MKKKIILNKIAVDYKNKECHTHSFPYTLFSIFPEITWCPKDRNFAINYLYTLSFTPLFATHSSVTSDFSLQNYWSHNVEFVIFPVRWGYIQRKWTWVLQKKCFSQARDTIWRNALFSENVVYILLQYLFIIKHLSYSWVAEGLTSSL